MDACGNATAIISLYILSLNKLRYTRSTRQEAALSSMQFGIFSVSDITRDPVTGRTPTEGERI